MLLTGDLLEVTVCVIVCICVLFIAVVKITQPVSHNYLVDIYCRSHTFIRYSWNLLTNEIFLIF